MGAAAQLDLAHKVGTNVIDVAHENSTPDHEPVIPWPKADMPTAEGDKTHKPMKLKG
jgi:hypothetical protein